MIDLKNNKKSKKNLIKTKNCNKQLFWLFFEESKEKHISFEQNVNKIRQNIWKKINKLLNKKKFFIYKKLFKKKFYLNFLFINNLFNSLILFYFSRDFFVDLSLNKLIFFLNFLEKWNLDYNFFFFKLIFLMIKSIEYTNFDKNCICLFIKLFIIFDCNNIDLNNFMIFLWFKKNFLKSKNILNNFMVLNNYSIFFFSFDELKNIQKFFFFKKKKLLFLNSYFIKNLFYFLNLKKLIFQKKFYLFEIKFIYFFFLWKFIFFLKSFKNVFKKNILINYWNILINSWSLTLNCSFFFQKIINLDIFSIISVVLNFNLSSLFNFFFFNFFFSKKFEKKLFYKSTLTFFESFLVKKNFLFINKFFFFKEINFFLNLIRIIKLDLTENILNKTIKKISNIQIIDTLPYYGELTSLLVDLKIMDVDFVKDKFVSTTISKIWMDTLTDYLKELFKKKKMDVNVQYSPLFNHMHELILYLKWGLEVELIKFANLINSTRFFGLFQKPFKKNILRFKISTLININNKYKEEYLIFNKPVINKYTLVWNKFTWNNFFEIIIINISLTMVALWDFYWAQFTQFNHFSTNLNILDNFRSNFTSLFIYISLFRWLRYNFFKFFFGWSSYWIPFTFWKIFSKNYYLSLILNYTFFSKKKNSLKIQLSSLFINSFFYFFLFKIFLTSKKNLQKYIKSDFFFDQLWVNIFKSFKSFMLPINFSFGLTPIINLKTFILNKPKNFYINGLLNSYEINNYLYDSNFFLNFFFDWYRFMSDVILSNVKNIFEKKKLKKKIKIKNLSITNKLSKYMYPLFFNFSQKNFFENKLENFLLKEFSSIFQVFFLDFLISQFINFSEVIKYNTEFGENFFLIKELKNLDFLNTIFSNSFSYIFLSNLNSKLKKKKIWFFKKYIFLTLNFLIFLEKEILIKIDFFIENFLVFYFSKINNFSEKINKNVAMEYCNYFLIEFLFILLYNDIYLSKFLNEIINKFIYYSLNSFFLNKSDFQIWNFLFSDFYLKEFYPNLKIFFFRCLIRLLLDFLK